MGCDFAISDLIVLLPIQLLLVFIHTIIIIGYLITYIKMLYIIRDTNFVASWSRKDITNNKTGFCLA